MLGKGVVLLLLMVCAMGLMDYVAAQNNPCPAICDTSKLQPVSQEGASTTDVLSAVKVTLDIMLGAITEVPLIGELAAGAQMLMDTGYSLWTAWDSVANPQLSIKNSLHNDMVQLQDYLVCEMTSIVFQAESTIINTMTQKDLDKFNAFIDNTVASLTNECGALNCLNVTNLPPSQRNAAVNNNCVVPNPSGDCQNVNSWNAMAPTACSGTDSSGARYQGICDTDKMCYVAGLSRQGARDFFTGISRAFNGGNINNLFGLDEFSLDDMQPLVMGAKMSLLQINLYQQLIMHGSGGGENTTLKAFANEAASWLQARYNYHTDIDRIRTLVANHSTITPGVSRDGTVNPVLSGSIVNVRGEGQFRTATCLPRGDAEYSYPDPCFVWNAFYGSYQLGWGCAAAQSVPVYQQTESFCYWQKQHVDGIKPPCSHDTLPYGFTDAARTNPRGVCGDFYVGQGTCTFDNDFPKNWMDQHNQALQTSYDKAKEQLAQQLLANVTATLADVAGTIANLKKLATVGMPAKSLNIFAASSYPLQQCDPPAAARSAATAATVPSGNVLKGDGAVPLPAGAMLVTAPAASPATRTGGSRKYLKL